MALEASSLSRSAAAARGGLAGHMERRTFVGMRRAQWLTRIVNMRRRLHTSGYEGAQRWQRRWKEQANWYRRSERPATSSPSRDDQVALER